MKKETISLILLISSVCISAKTYFLSPSGNDSNSGKINAPFWSFNQVQSVVNPGDTVYLRGGTYQMNPSDVDKIDSLYDARITGYRYWSYVNYMTKSGSSGKRINYWAYPGEKVVLDFTNIKPVDHRVIGFWVTGSWLYFKGFDVVGVQVNCKISSQSECFHNEGSNNIYEQLNMHDGMAIGFYLTKGTNNLVLNCDAYNNYDYYSGDKKGGNTDGFGFHPSKGGTGNIARGCRAWFNSDDGYDCISSSESVTFDNCWAFYNGYTPALTEKGDGNGFKIGGHGANPTLSSLPNPMPSHITRNCLAYYNKRYGFTSNHHVVAANYFYNNTGWDNKLANFCMLSKKIVKSIAGVDSAAVDCPGFSQIMRNNLSYIATRGLDTAFIGSCVLTYNSFSPLYTEKITADDFISTDITELTSSRNADGSLPEIQLMHLKSTSKLIDKGFNVGLAFNGAAPDFGAFEYKINTDVNEIGIENNWFYPNPTSGEIHFKNSNVKIEIYNLGGKCVFTFNALDNINLHILPKGVYIIKQIDDLKSTLTGKLIKIN